MKFLELFFKGEKAIVSICLSFLPSTALASGLITHDQSASNINNKLISQSYNQESLCKEKIAKIGNILSSKYKLDLTNVGLRNIFYTQSPFSEDGRQLDFTLQVGGYSSVYSKQKSKNAQNFLNSPKTQLALAKSIFDKCSSIHVVNFGAANTDWNNPYFRMPSGAAMTGVPLPCGPESGQELTWGYYKSC